MKTDTPITQKKNHIGALFDRISGTYDFLNHFLSLGIDRYWRQKAIAGMPPQEEVLDVAIGTADLTLEMFRQHKAQKVVGIDLSVWQASRRMGNVGAYPAHARVCLLHPWIELGNVDSLATIVRVDRCATRQRKTIQCLPACNGYLQCVLCSIRIS